MSAKPFTFGKNIRSRSIVLEILAYAHLKEDVIRFLFHIGSPYRLLIFQRAIEIGRVFESHSDMSLDSRKKAIEYRLTQANFIKIMSQTKPFGIILFLAASQGIITTDDEHFPALLDSLEAQSNELKDLRYL